MDSKKEIGIKKERNQTVIKKTELTEFVVELTAKDGLVTGGRVIHKKTREAFYFNDVHEMLKVIDKKYDDMYYPQPQNRLRDWDELVEKE